MNTSGLKPLGKAVLLKLYEVEEKTSGGLILPRSVTQQNQMAEQRAVVIEVGPCAWSDEPTPRAEVGDKVLYSRYAGYEAEGTADHLRYRVVNDRDIFLRIVEETEKE